MRPNLVLATILALSISIQSQTVDAYMDANTPSTGGTTSVPFGAGPTSVNQASANTMVQLIPAVYLVAAGLVPGATLEDIALAPTSTGQLICNQLHAVIGHAVNPWSSTQFFGNIGGYSTIYDSSLSGVRSWAVFGNTWNNLNTQPIGFSWDGVSDLALYISAGNVISTSITPGGPISIFGSTVFRHAGGVSSRNYSPGFNSTTPTVSDNKGLKVRMTFTNVPSNPPGTISFTPSSGVVSPGSPLVVTYNAPYRGGDLFIPYIACLPGTTPIVGTPFTLPLAWDSCTDYYFLDPAGLTVFQLATPGSFFGTLSNTGIGVGVINIPVGLLPPLTVPVHITFMTSDVNGINQVHGLSTCIIHVP